MSLNEIPLVYLALALPVMALATAGIWATMVTIPKSLQGVYRMHIYAPPAGYFIGCALFVCMVGPLTGVHPAGTINLISAAAIAAVFAVVGFISLKRGGHAVLFR